MQLALFDLDNTLLDLDSDHEWGEFLIAQGLVDENAHRAKNDQFFADYQSGTLDAVAYNEFVFQFFAHKTQTELRTLHDVYMQTVIRPAMRPMGIAAIEKHRQAGHEIVIITATNRFVTTPIAEAFGVKHLLASNPEMIDGFYTGKLQGEPCFQAGKLNHLNQWLAMHHNDASLESWAYSDSFNDLPLLSFADHAVAVTPDDRLRAYALAHQWPIKDWSLKSAVS
jgi:HAD superfamily hydrolase (TIGR01490 family)